MVVGGGGVVLHCTILYCVVFYLCCNVLYCWPGLAGLET